MKSDHSRWIAKEVAEEFKSPYEEIAAYLARLHRAEVVYRTSRGAAYHMHHRLREGIRATIAKEEEPERRRSELAAAVRAIADLMQPDDGVLEDFDRWLENQAGMYGIRDRILLSNDGVEFEDLMARLRRVIAAATWPHRSSQSDTPEDMVGLALDGMFQRLRIARDLVREREDAERLARREREAAEAAERLAREAADRVFKIEEQAHFIVEDVEAFFETSLPGNEGKTARKLAEESITGFAAVQRELNRIRHADQLATETERVRNDMVSQLWERVYRKIPRREMADLWATQPWKELGGMRPVDYCKDKVHTRAVLRVFGGLGQRTAETRASLAYLAPIASADVHQKRPLRLDLMPPSKCLQLDSVRSGLLSPCGKLTGR